uniref:Cyclin N-terminal domain-containing protein n=1 Tax=Noctiluca scintillans TaxID=2966 RepID=A0A7S1AEG6_NOCSC
MHAIVVTQHVLEVSGEPEDSDEGEGSTLWPSSLAEKVGRLGDLASSIEALPTSQPIVDARSRASAVRWIMEVHAKFGFTTQTLFLAVTILDKYLVLTQVQEMEVTGAGALFVAAKFEEASPPDIRDFTFVGGLACTKQAVLAMEVNMLSAVEFALVSPTAAHFLTKYQEAHPQQTQQHHLMQYLLELALLDAGLATCQLFFQAAGAVLVSAVLLDLPVPLPGRAAGHTEYAAECVRHCAREFEGLLRAASAADAHHRVVHDKFLKPEFGAVSSVASQRVLGVA